MMAYVCRKCFYYADSAVPLVCPQCSCVDMVVHGELFSLAIAHLDCDSFYTAVEKRDDESLAHKPVIVGRKHRGVVAAACYIARIYGVRSAQPMFKALKLCPHAVVIAPDMQKYKHAGQQVRKAMKRVSAKIEPISIDEAYLDLSDNFALHNEPPCVSLLRLADVVRDSLGITVSIGLSYNKLLAKLASDRDKPKGFYVIGEGEAREFLATLPVRSLWGVGPQSEKKLMKHGFLTVAQIQETDVKELVRIFGKFGYHLHMFANARDSRVVSCDSEVKSISAETTFREDLVTLSQLSVELEPLCAEVSRRLRVQGLRGGVVTIKLKDSGFRNVTRSRRVGDFVRDGDVIYGIARMLLGLYIGDGGGGCGRSWRLLGVSVSGLDDVGVERDMFRGGDSGLGDIVRGLRAKFGEGVINWRGG